LTNITPKQSSLTSPHTKLSQSSRYCTTQARRNKETNDVTKKNKKRLFIKEKRSGVFWGFSKIAGCTSNVAGCP